MSIDACNLNTSSILLKKIRPSNNVIVSSSTEDNTTSKKGRSSSFSKLQSVGLSLVASVSKRRVPAKDGITTKYGSTTSLPNRTSTPRATQPPAPPPTKLKPSISARPFSQFFFPIKEEREETFEPSSNKNNKIKIINEREPQQQIQHKQQQQQQPQQRSCSRPRQFNTKRHSIAIDLLVDDTTTGSNTSSRSSSLKTIKNQPIVDNVVIATPETISGGIQSDITFSTTKRNLSRSTSPQQQTNRLSGVARARTVLGLDSIKSREMRAINVWKDTVSQLSSDDLYEDNSEDQDLEDDSDGLYEILSHPALSPEHPLERQRFVRRSSPKDLAMMRFILNELNATEKSYNQLLLLIQNRYMHPMIAASQSKDPLVKSTDIPILFNHLPELVQLSDRLLTQFENTNNIGQVFRSIESDLVVFLKYAMHYRTNIKTIRRACSNVLFVKIDQENLARRDTNRLGMSDYFIAPIQRIPRYCLLIKDLQKYTHPLDNNYQELDFALKTLTGLAVAMDHVQNKVPPPSRTSIRTL